MYLAILLLIALVGLIFGFFLYRTLVRSAFFAKLIGETVEPPPVLPGETIDRLRVAKSQTQEQIDNRFTAIRTARDEAGVLRDELCGPSCRKRKRSDT